MSLPEDFKPAVEIPDELSPESWAFAFRDQRLLVHTEDQGARLPSLRELEIAAGNGNPDLDPVRRQYLGTYLGRGVVSLEIDTDAEAPDGMAFCGLRGLFHRVDEPLFWIAARAVQIVAWDRDHHFCGRCATATETQPGEHSRKCPSCGLMCYPRLSPAVIVLVERGDEVLLGRSPHFVPGMYSTLAGFVEPGESLEQTVAREIEEEVGVKLTNVRYFGSQPWPFPNSLMLGFRAEWASGDIVIGDEIEDAGWFHVDNLPRIPPNISIARALIEAWISEHRGTRRV
ncbi:MAG: NAD(+) diphosphatase [bacterium]|nr:NAD(+) diphosphatase [bacterium]